MTHVTLKQIRGKVPLTLCKGHDSVPVRGVAEDSRQIRTGDMFYARKGDVTDGHMHIDDAVRRGASVICVTRDDVPVSGECTVVFCEDTQDTRAAIADAVYGTPSCSLIGITGTNGKTTTAYMIRHFLSNAGIPTGLISTVAYEYDERSIPAKRTTPGVFEMYARLNEMTRAGAECVVMEVSSHALAQKRIGYLTYDAVVFTNLTQDHLDFHKTMENYFDAKSILFTRVRNKDTRKCMEPAVINCDDEWGRKLIKKCRESDVPVRTYSIASPCNADICAKDIHISTDGCEFTFVMKNNECCRVHASVIGRHNIYNCLAAMAVAEQYSCTPEQLCKAGRTIPPVPGRLEFIHDDQGRLIVVDYAHTDDALINVLQCVREVTKKHIWIVIGCGGDRDKTKRPKMGAAAEKYADKVILTSDNPRTEDPGEIINDIRSGMSEEPTSIKLDRKEAILFALEHAADGDTVVIAGKGHETYQEINRVFHSFDDRKIVRSILNREETHDICA